MKNLIKKLAYSNASIAFEYILVTLFTIAISVLVLRYSKKLIFEKISTIENEMMQEEANDIFDSDDFSSGELDDF